MRRIISSAILLILSIVAVPTSPILIAQVPDPPTPPIDTLDTPDSVPAPSIPDSLARVDSVTPPRPTNPPPFVPVGSLQPTSSFGVTSDDLRALAERYASTLYDIIAPSLPGFSLSTGTPGLRNAFAPYGADPSLMTILYAGRPVTAQGGREPDLSSMPALFMERLERLEGIDASLHGGAQALSAVNIVPPQYDVEGSYVLLGYHRARGGASIVDVQFARNVCSDLTFAVAARRVSNDDYFKHQKVDGWGLSGSLQWRPTTEMTWLLSMSGREMGRDINGGLTNGSSFAQIFNIVNDETTRVDRSRRDVTLTAHWSRSDSTMSAEQIRASSRLTGSIYYGHDGRRFAALGDSSTMGAGSWAVDQIGAQASGRLPLGSLALDPSVHLQIDNGTIGLAHAGVVIGDDGSGLLGLRGGGGVTMYGDVFGLALLGRLRYGRPGSELLLDARYMLGDGPIHALPADSMMIFLPRNSRMVVETRYVMSGRVANGTIGAAAHMMPELGATAATTTIHLFGNLKGSLGSFDWSLDATTALVRPEEWTYPRLHAGGDLSYRYDLFGGALELRSGAAVGFSTASEGIIWSPYEDRWGFSVDTTRPAAITGFQLMPYTTARIGSAFFTFALDNALDREYRDVARYPYPGRTFRFGLTWAFID